MVLNNTWARVKMHADRMSEQVLLGVAYRFPNTARVDKPPTLSKSEDIDMMSSPDGETTRKPVQMSKKSSQKAE